MHYLRPVLFLHELTIYLCAHAFFYICRHEWKRKIFVSILRCISLAYAKNILIIYMLNVFRSFHINDFMIKVFVIWMILLKECPGDGWSCDCYVCCLHWCNTNSCVRIKKTSAFLSVHLSLFDSHTTKCHVWIKKKT